MTRFANMVTASALRDACFAVVPHLQRSCRDPWVVIGSAAARLLGADVTVADLDVLVSVRDAEALMDRWEHPVDRRYAPANADRFRSRFARYVTPGLPVEVMGGLEVFGANGWERVQIGAVITADFSGLAIPVPSIIEQIRVLKLFGRAKDLQRAILLQSMNGSGTC